MPSAAGVRILAIDPGEKRIGVAAADTLTRVAIPLTTLDAGTDPVEAVARLAEEEGAKELVVGLALSLSGAAGHQAQRAQELARALEERLGVPVHTWDERLTSAEARRHSSGQARRRHSEIAPAKGKQRRQRGAVDAIAAAIILQAYLDAQPRPAPG